MNYIFVIDFLQARSEWNELHSFNEEIKKRRNILKSVLDTVSEKPAINGNDLGVQIPNLLLQEFQREIQMVISYCCD